MCISVSLIKSNTGEIKRLYEDIPDFEQAELLAQLAINNKKDFNDLIVIFPGFSREIKEEELETALRLADEYKAI